MQVAISIQLANVHSHTFPVNECWDSDPSLAAMVTVQVSDKAHGDKNEKMAQQPIQTQCLPTLSCRVETKVNAGNVGDLARSCRCHNTCISTDLPELQLGLERDFLKRLPFPAASVCSSAALLSKAAHGKPALVDGPEPLAPESKG